MHFGSQKDTEMTYKIDLIIDGFLDRSWRLWGAQFGAHLCSKTDAKIEEKMDPKKGCPDRRTQIGAQGTPRDGVGQPKGVGNQSPTQR